MSADLLLFNKHVEEASFQMGIDQGMWGIADENPHPLTSPSSVIIWIHAHKLPDGSNRLYLKFDITNYPSSAPTACPWNTESKSRLTNELWPKGSSRVTAVFNPNWNPNALYTPCDRLAMAGHDPWKPIFPHLWWRSDFKIDVYLNHIHGLLNPF